MKNLTLTTILVICLFSVKAQKIDTCKTCAAVNTFSDEHFVHAPYQTNSVFGLMNKEDTDKVYAACLDTATLEIKWHKLLAIRSLLHGYVDFNGLLIYYEYLMPDRKTPSIYKVIYCVK